MKLFTEIAILLLISLVLLCQGFQPSFKNSRTSTTFLSMSEKKRMIVRVSGKSVYESLFRAEVKKELNFFRGCAGIMSSQMGWMEFKEAGMEAPSSGSDSVYITAEGRETQLNRFLDWLDQMKTPLESRKISFQGPPTLVDYDRSSEVLWMQHTGELEGFTVASDMPVMPTWENTVTYAADGSVIEAKSMQGTDESV